ncbi:inositol monophosphatase 3 [Trichonephila inaurata madagascariensis]|uniref:inositol-phosphate phosphatase n=1 Tax=Trichonephila inaurata madagascariensis TaxID=2747483 RepID=A0A8X6Y164_9ARAC|nr:inositol monophosphatase 3 [Trichonephila inaurata madagascariensis]
MYVTSKILGILLMCVVIVFFISFYNDSGKWSIKVEKSISYNSETYLMDDPGYNYVVKSFPVIFEEDKAIKLESEIDPQSFHMKNTIEYIDFTLKDSENKIMTYEGLNVVSLKHLLSVCIEAAIAGGLQLRSVRKNYDLKNIWGLKTTDKATNPVSVGRTLSHSAMTYTLRHSFPSIKLVSRVYNGFEIEPYKKGFQVDKPPDDILVPLKNVLVWFDPLDAEQEYKNNFLEYVTTTVCVAVEGKPVIGVIHQPFENFTKWGWVGKGVSNTPYPVASEPIDVSRPLTIAVETAQRTYARVEAEPIFGRYFDRIVANGAGYKFLQLTEGKTDLFIHLYSIKKWKMCAGNALIDALDGKMTTTDEEDVNYGDPSDVTNSDGIVASIVDKDIPFYFINDMEYINAL